MSRSMSIEWLPLHERPDSYLRLSRVAFEKVSQQRWSGDARNSDARLRCAHRTCDDSQQKDAHRFLAVLRGNQSGMRLFVIVSTFSTAATGCRRGGRSRRGATIINRAVVPATATTGNQFMGNFVIIFVAGTLRFLVLHVRAALL